MLFGPSRHFYKIKLAVKIKRKSRLLNKRLMSTWPAFAPPEADGKTFAKELSTLSLSKKLTCTGKEYIFIHHSTHSLTPS